jgi:hypothetical protein
LNTLLGEAAYLNGMRGSGVKGVAEKGYEDCERGNSAVSRKLSAIGSNIGATDREAVRLLTEIIEKLSVVSQDTNRVVFTFASDFEFHDRLCIWGAVSKDLEDDAPLEDDQ